MSANWSGRTLSQATPAGWRKGVRGLDQLEFGRDEVSAESWLSMTTSAFVDDLRGMNGGRDRGRSRRQGRTREKCPARDRRSPAPLPVRPPRRVTATQPTTQKSSFGMSSKPHGLAMRHKALRGRRGLEIDALGGELFGVDAQIGEALGQVGNGREQQLAVVERPEPHRDLRRVGIAFDDPRLLPGVEFAEPLGRGVGADEIRDAVEGGPDADARRDERAPTRGCARRPSPRFAPPSAIGPLS